MEDVMLAGSSSAPKAFLFGAVLSLASACGSGSVELIFLLPESEQLAPATDEIAAITLVRTAPGEPAVRSLHHARPGEGVDLGRVEAGQGVHLAVELRSANQRLLAYGRSGELDISPGDSFEVPVQLRRPFVYVAGDTSLATYDSTLDATDGAYRGAIEVGAPPLAIAGTADGAELLVVGESVAGFPVSVVSTSSHRMVATELAVLDQPPVDLVLTADGRHAIVAHAGDGGGVTMIDRDAAERGDPPVSFTPLGSVSRVAVSGDQVYALVDGAVIAEALDCAAPASSLVRVALRGAPDDPGRTELVAEFAAPVSDLAVMPEGQSLVVAAGCDNGGELQVVPIGDPSARRALAAVAAVSAVAVFEDRVWGVGTMYTAGENQARLELVSVAAGGTEPTRLELPSVQERARIPDLSQPGEEATRQLDADDMTVYDLMILPGADYAALLTRGYFYASAQGNILGTPVLPEMEIDNREYMLVDTTTGTLVHRVRARCDLTWGNAVTDDWECTLSSGQDGTSASHTPRSITALYGAP